MTQTTNIINNLAKIAVQGGERNLIDTPKERDQAIAYLTKEDFAEEAAKLQKYNAIRFQVNRMYDECHASLPLCDQLLVPISDSTAALGFFVFSRKTEFKTVPKSSWAEALNSLEQNRSSCIRRTKNGLSELYVLARFLRPFLPGLGDIAVSALEKHSDYFIKACGPDTMALQKAIQSIDSIVSPQNDVDGVLGNLLVFSEGQQDCLADSLGINQIVSALHATGALPNYELGGIVAANRRGHLGVLITNKISGKEYIIDAWFSGRVDISTRNAWNTQTEMAIPGVLDKF